MSHRLAFLASLALVALAVAALGAWRRVTHPRLAAAPRSA